MSATTALVVGVGEQPAGAHAGLRSSEPAAGAYFEAAPTTVRLTFLEAPEPSLAVIRVSGAGGTSYTTGRPAPVPGDALTLAVPVNLPDRRIYTVTWRAVSAVDGHPAGGTFAFGVGVLPNEVAATAPSTQTLRVSPLELLGRWAFSLGLIAVLGSAVASLFGFAGSATGRRRESDAGALGPLGLVAAAVGLLLLGEAQRQAGSASLGDLLGTSVGHALVWRAVALGAVAASLALGRSSRGARWVTAAAASAAIAAHVAAGHAGAPGSWRAAIVAAQWLHVVAVAIWAGGLAALLLGLRGSSEDRAGAVRRFSSVAAPALAVIVVTGTIRAVGGVRAWAALTSTGYGRVVLVKAALVVVIVGLAAANRYRGVPAARAASLRLLRRLSGYELVLAIGALGAAALLASLPPPSVLRGVDPPGLTATGSDAATTVRVRLRTATAAPGPNRFAVEVIDYDTRQPVVADRVSLRFRPLDDPGIEPTELVLEPAPGPGPGPGPRPTYGAVGANLSLDGRWAITAIVQRGPEAVSVPLEVHTRSAPQFLSVLRVPGDPVKYTVELVSGGGFLRVWADPPRVGHSRLYATFFDRFGEPLPVGDPVLTTGSGPSARQQVLTRLDRNQFVADVELAGGDVNVAVIARTVEGDQRFRGSVTLEVPRRS